MLNGSPGYSMRALNNMVANNQGTGFTIYAYDAELVHNTIIGNGKYGVEGDVNVNITPHLHPFESEM